MEGGNGNGMDEGRCEWEAASNQPKPRPKVPETRGSTSCNRIASQMLWQVRVCGAQSDIWAAHKPEPEDDDDYEWEYARNIMPRTRECILNMFFVALFLLLVPLG
nr:uncharacterized protein LOC108076360 [Drosophila kikkawai]